MIDIKFYLLIIVLATIVFTKSYAAETIPITISFDRDKVILDGKWTSVLEWKRSSLTDLSYKDGKIELRTAHQGNFIYAFIDDLLDTTFTKGSDKATICFDTLNNKSINPDSGDYCFVSTLGSYYPTTLQGNGSLGETNYFKKISNPKNLVGIGGISDENDRYSTTPHAGYEFKIPTDFLGRESTYGFYMVLYHANNDKYYSWPENSTGISLTNVPSPSLWGDLVSPDSSLPEFSTPIIILISSLIFITYLTRSRIKSSGLSGN